MSEDKKVVPFTGRKAIPKSIRFAVFKRDAFTCQYCGAKAPDVLLQVDHIKPVADGGENEIVNLVTSCAACNGGKGAELLDENAAIEKQRKQLTELTERRNQLEMMLEWREGLRDLQGEYIKAIQAEFLLFSPFMANETAERDIKKWLKQYDLNEILEAISTSFTQYLKTDDDGKVTSDSWNRAFHMVPRIAGVNKRGGMDPVKMRLYYIRGICRNRFSYVDEAGIMSMLQRCADAGADIDVLTDLAKTLHNWSQFREVIYDFLDKHEGEDGADS